MCLYIEQHHGYIQLTTKEANPEMPRERVWPDRESMTLSTEYMLSGVLYCLLTATGTVPPGLPGKGRAARL